MDPGREQIFIVKMTREMLSQLFAIETPHSDQSTSNIQVSDTPLYRKIETPKISH